MQKEISDVNKRIKHYRILAGYTQETAAQALDMKKNTYAYMERYGNPSPEILMKLSQLYNVSVSEIFYGKINTRPIDPPPFPVDLITPEDPAPIIRQPEPVVPKSEPPLILTAHEKGMMKIFRQLSSEDRKNVMNFINDIYKSNRK